MRRRWIVLLVLGAACGGGDDNTPAVQEQGERFGAPVPTAAAPPPSGSDTTTSVGLVQSTTSTTVGSVPATDHGPSSFKTPTGNIGCDIRDEGVRCDILERTWEPPPPPSTCDAEYGHGLSLDARGTGFVCAGDTVLGASATLPYGESSRVGRYFCESASTGVTCRDSVTGRGFFLSRARYEFLR